MIGRPSAGIGSVQPAHRALIGLLAGMVFVVGFIGSRNSALLPIIFGGIALTAAVGMFRDTHIEKPDRHAQIVLHLNGLIGCGIGVYTAFFAFGGSRLLGEILTGYWWVVPWVLSVIMGTFAINRLERSFKRSVPKGERSSA